MLAIVFESDNPKKKYKVVIHSGRWGQDPIDMKSLEFGAKGYSDYTIHGDKNRRANYIARHMAKENWEDPYTAGFWSRWLLWNKETLQKSADDIKKRFGIDVYIY